MLPYTYSLAWKVYRDDYTMLRSLMFDFAQDEAVKELKEEFMYGPSYLVCPVTDPMEYGPENTPIATSGKVEIYLPKGADWYAEETEQYFERRTEASGGSGVDTMPVFIRAGSVIPKHLRRRAVWMNSMYMQAPMEALNCMRMGARIMNMNPESIV